VRSLFRETLAGVVLSPTARIVRLAVITATVAARLLVLAPRSNSNKAAFSILRGMGTALPGTPLIGATQAHPANTKGFGSDESSDAFVVSFSILLHDKAPF